MRRRRLPLGVLLPAGMLVLVCTLAVLQYQWLGRISEAEAERLRTSLEHSALEFANDFDQEISGVYLALQATDAEALANGDAADFARRYAGWRESSRFPGLVAAVYFATGDGAPRALSVYDEVTGTFQPTEWPETLAGVRDRLRPPDPAPVSPVLPDAPAIVVPIQRAFVASERPDAAGVVRRSGALDFQEVLVEFRSHRDVLVVALDASHLRETMLRALAERHFPEQGAERYHVSIVDGSSAPVLTRGVPDGEVIPLDRADVAVPFFGIRLGRMSLTSSSPSAHVMAWTITRPDGTRRAAEPSETPAPGSSRNLAVILDERMVADAGTAVATARLRSPAMRVAEEGWQVRLQHADGSLEAAVANARARNLWLSFGMLALLVASAGLVVVNAQRSERLAARQMDFVATVSHELRTPLAVIRSAAQNLQAGVVLGHEQARRYGDLIEDEGRRLTDMVEQVLEYAGLSGNRQALRAQAVDVRSLVDEALESCRARLEDGRFEVSVAVPADLPPVMGDADALRRALQNLIANAVKYAADGRWLGVRAELTPRGAREVRLSVSDHGRGIEADDLPHIFEPFYRGRYAQERQIHGNGLGLSLVKRIADVHSGRLTASSTPGEGATFTLHLPVATGTPEPDVLGAAAPEARGRSI